MYNTPPLHQHNFSTDDLLSDDEKQLLLRHFRCTVGKQTNEFEIAVKKFTNEERRAVGNLYERMREAGFYPVSCSALGIKWAVALTPESLHKVAMSQPDLPRNPDQGQVKKMQSECRAKWRDMVD